MKETAIARDFVDALLDAARTQQPAPELPDGRGLSAAEIRAALNNYAAELQRRRPRSGRTLFGL
jgi:hypothetical protein